MAGFRTISRSTALAFVQQEIQHGPIEFGGVLGGDEMAAFHETELRARDALRDQARVVFGDHVVRTGDHEHGHGKRCEIRRVYPGFVDHEPQKLECMLVACFFGVRVFGGDFRIHLIGQPRGEKVRPVEDQLRHALGMRQSEQQRDIRPIGEAEQARLAKPPIVQECAEVIGKLRKCERCSAARRGAVPARVDRDDAEALGEERHLMLEVRAVLPVAVEQDERLARAVLGKEA